VLSTQRCFEPTSIQRLAIETRPRICLHSEPIVPIDLPPLAVWFDRAERCAADDAGYCEKNGESARAV